jgi:DNA-binding response OmpR family regulator
MSSDTQPIILVVEDERPLAHAIEEKLSKSGFATVTARSVEQANGYLADLERIDAVWLDHYLLGKETGLDFVAALKAEGSKWKNLPIFVVSNTASPEKVQSYLALGVDKYFTKADYRLDQIIHDLQAHLKVAAI